MSDCILRTPVVSPEILMESAAQLAEAHRSLTIGELSQLIDRSETYTESIVTLGGELSLIEHAEDEGDYVINRSARMQVRQSSSSQKVKLLNGRLQQYRPFISFVSALVQGTEPTQAARQVRVMYEFEVSEDHLENQFIKLGIYSEIFEDGAEDGDFQFTINTRILTEEFIQEVAEAVRSPLIARLFLQKRLSEEIIQYLNQDTVLELTNALELFWDRPRSAIAAAGRAVEDVERELGDDYGNNQEMYKQADGIGELADCLQSDGLIDSRHLHAGKYLGSMRNPSGGHGIDAETLERWEVAEEVAFGYILSSIHFIRSLYVYVVQDRQVL